MHNLQINRPIWSKNVVEQALKKIDERFTRRGRGLLCAENLTMSFLINAKRLEMGCGEMSASPIIKAQFVERDRRQIKIQKMCLRRCICF